LRLELDALGWLIQCTTKTPTRLPCLLFVVVVVQKWEDEDRRNAGKKFEKGARR